MTWTMKVRGAPTPTIASEYICPVHGRFRLDVERVDGEAPAEVRCIRRVEARMINLFGATTEERRDRQTCRERCAYAISAPRGKVKTVEVVRGGYQKPGASTWTNTENLGEGQDYDDWVADRDKVWEREREDSIKELIDG